VVALSKSDLVDGELRDLALADVAETLQGTFLEGARSCRCRPRAARPDALKSAIAAALREVPGKVRKGWCACRSIAVFSIEGLRPPL